MNTLYTYENWYQPISSADGRGWSYEGLLAESLGEEQILCYFQEEDYQGDWAAIVTDGERIGLVEGSFGSCGGCDALEAAHDNGDVQELLESYLQAVRTFSSWEDVRAWLQESVKERTWAFRGFKERLLAFAGADLPLAAREIYTCLVRDDPSGDVVRAAEIAKTLFGE